MSPPAARTTAVVAAALADSVPDATGRFVLRARFRRTLTAYAQAVRAKDVEAFAALYDPDVHVFDMWGTWSLRGLPAWCPEPDIQCR